MMWCWHKWSKWEEFMWVGKIQARWGDTDMVDINERHQKRRCEKCGKFQETKVQA